MSAVSEVINASRQEQVANVALNDPALVSAREKAVLEGTKYAGSISPHDAWRLFSARQANLVDVRTAEELKFVGHVADNLHVPWQLGPNMVKNPRFTRELESKVKKDEVVFLLCRSGKRSAAAAEAATKAGFKYVFNIAEGFEGDLDEQQQRGANNGWRHRGLPWVQD